MGGKVKKTAKKLSVGHRVLGALGLPDPVGDFLDPPPIPDEVSPPIPETALETTETPASAADVAVRKQRAKRRGRAGRRSTVATDALGLTGGEAQGPNLLGV